MSSVVARYDTHSGDGGSQGCGISRGSQVVASAPTADASAVLGAVGTY